MRKNSLSIRWNPLPSWKEIFLLCSAWRIVQIPSLHDLVLRHGKSAVLSSAFENPIFVVMAYNDKFHIHLTHLPTLQRSSIGLFLCISACNPYLTVYSRDISQAFTQSSTKQSWPSYFEPPSALDCPEKHYYSYWTSAICDPRERCTRFSHISQASYKKSSHASRNIWSVCFAYW